MKSVASALRAAHSEDQLYLLLAKRNSGSFTYDGIERGGERVCLEIEEELELIRSRGGKITKLSIVGYSLGGLVARYAVGLLYAKGVLDQVEPINFTTFATPHLGVRTPLRGWHNDIWNVLGARTLSTSGAQLFTIDDFRSTGRPLLAILADPDTIFMSGLARFRRRTLYTNVVNDRSAVYYTTAITKHDPYTDVSRLKPNYLPRYAPVILDPTHPVTPAPPRPRPRTWGEVLEVGTGYARAAPLVLALALFVPLGVTAFLLNALVQTVRSSKRIRAHETGVAGVPVADYRGMPLWYKELRGTVEDAYENLASAQGQSYLTPADSSEDEEDEDGDGGKGEEEEILALERRQSHPQFPTLALTPAQFAMIKALDQVGWRKYPVWIHECRHSHAAIIVRSDAARFKEGHVVLRHWTKEEFLI
ncbi:putative serine esterase-domain-containing protein [Whalleya microplaca]|nr:putative serine esterase-domain-containing protein [Whalleya microplaca]